jgi:hypothetical protein
MTTPTTTSPDLVGPDYGPRVHSAAFEIAEDHPFVTAPAETALYRLVPSDLPAIRTMTAWHQLAEWTQLSVTIFSGPGSFGRSITLHWAWMPSALGTVRDLADISSSPTYSTRTFGGTAESPPIAITVPAPIGEAFSARAHPAPDIGSRHVFWLHVTHADLGDTQAPGAWITVRFLGNMHVWGGVH